jgi:hypothetical protein
MVRGLKLDLSKEQANQEIHTEAANITREPSYNNQHNRSFQNEHKQSKHPDRLGINLWTKGKYPIQHIRQMFNINRNIVRERGIRQFTRIILQCSNRQEVAKLCTIIKPKAKQLKIHVSKGTTYQDRYKKYSNNKISNSSYNNSQSKTRQEY